MYIEKRHFLCNLFSLLTILCAHCPTQTHTFPQGQGKALNHPRACGGGEAGGQAAISCLRTQPQVRGLGQTGAPGLWLCLCQPHCFPHRPQVVSRHFCEEDPMFCSEIPHLPWVWTWCLRQEGEHRHCCQRGLRNGWG